MAGDMGYSFEAESDTTDSNNSTKLYVPLQFWFCRNPGLALPLIALQYHEVKFNITFETKANLFCTAASYDAPASSDLGASLWVDYMESK